MIQENKDGIINMKSTITNVTHTTHIPQYTTNFPLPDKLTPLIRLPGVPVAGPANTLMLSAARRIDTERVFVAGSGLTASALWAA
jgi:hypothetical protein